jgi:glyoxylase-like metal-dependent hydrolase (beta-lactamase superfamily II)/rhodanese-related sulfurtransferase
MIFRQLFDPQSSTFSYLLGDESSREAVLIDPVLEQVRRDFAVIEDLGLRLLWSLDTHVHADHVTGARALQKRAGSQIAISRASGAQGADRYLEPEERVTFGTRYLRALATPGHTRGCLSFVLDDLSRVFTGDSLLIRSCGRTDFQEGSAVLLYKSVHQSLFCLPDSCLVYPGHDYRGLCTSSIGEEKRFNPRLGGARSVADFTGSMEHLGLPHPKKIDVAVPANLHCGALGTEGPATADPQWAPLSFSSAGIWEIDPRWLEENAASVQIVDVREPHEWHGPLGHICHAIAIPLGQLKERAAELAPDRPIVTVCRAGGRSAQATVILGHIGRGDCASLAGGMLRWCAEGLATEDARNDP